MKVCLLFGAGAIAVLGGALTARATVLTFQATAAFPDDANLAGPPTSTYGDYGDNVTAADLASGHVSAINGRTYTYGSAGGATPDVTLTLGDTNGSPDSGSGNRIYQGYGDLPNKQLYLGHSGIAAGATAEVNYLILTAAPGFSVTLESLDIAALSAGSTLNVFRIFTNAAGTGSPIYDAVALNAGASVPVPNAGHSNYSAGQFGVISASEIRIELSKDASSNGPFYNIGIDNLQFSQVPEPATLSLIGLAGIALFRRRA